MMARWSEARQARSQGRDRGTGTACLAGQWSARLRLGHVHALEPSAVCIEAAAAFGAGDVLAGRASLHELAIVRQPLRDHPGHPQRGAAVAELVVEQEVVGDGHIASRRRARHRALLSVRGLRIDRTTYSVNACAMPKFTRGIQKAPERNAWGP